MLLGKKSKAKIRRKDCKRGRRLKKQFAVKMVCVKYVKFAIYLLITISEYSSIKVKIESICKVVGRVEDRGFSSVGSLPDGHNSQNWEKLKPAAGDVILICRRGGWDPSTWTIFSLPRHIIRAGSEAGTQTSTLLWDAGIPGSGLPYCITALEVNNQGI